ncbi:hypothetical protein PVL30_000884 [Lodderomyces elongisporus]|uniref:uncharacterized protein n=1 Tax=Lodderomyces elongisporus TaxID=36914 RepID=UPI00291D5093|nr:uncharacterized protein PVL30_000884 [Lodderomyces elongisporus]WLF77175.1 hypothetical protein PVL30_000884 [Lodderomyces elongisporus]
MLIWSSKKNHRFSKSKTKTNSNSNSNTNTDINSNARINPLSKLRKMRRSRGILLFITIIILHILILSLVKHKPIHQYIAENTKIPPKLRNFVLLATSAGLPKKNDMADFDYKLEEYLQKKTQTRLGASLEEGGISRKQVKDIEAAIAYRDFSNHNDNFVEITIPQRNELPELHQYDPRYTFGLLLKYINDKVDVTNADSLKNTLLPTFHWSDYTDMSILDSHFLSLEKETCKKFDVTKKSANLNAQNDLFHTETYCIDDDQLDQILAESHKYDEYFIARVRELASKAWKKDLKEDTKKRSSSLLSLSSFPSLSLQSASQRKQESGQELSSKRKLQPQLSTGFHIFSFSGRNRKALRPLIARSYLNDFMKAPLTMTFLLPNDKSFQVNVNQQRRDKLQDSELYQAGSVNLKDEILKLSNKLSSDFSTLPYEKELKHEMFTDNTPNKIQSLENQEVLNQTDNNYLNSLKTSLVMTDPPKYFREANIIKSERNFAIGAHYDWRFFNGIVNGTPKQGIAINGLVRAFMKLTNQYNLNTWVAHGSLLSWYWNGLQFPWDGDVDVQMPINDLHKLSQLFNQTVVVDLGNSMDEEIRYGRYFLDSSTFISQRVRGNGKNNIDARFIDLDTGLYIDITGLAVSNSRAPARYTKDLQGTKMDIRDGKSGVTEIERNSFMQVYNCRNYHFTPLKNLSPLRLSLVEGEYGYIPSGYDSMVSIEYGDKSMRDTTYRDHVFLPKLRMWVSKKAIVDFVYKDDDEAKKTQSRTKIPLKIDMTDEEYSEFLTQNPLVLRDYLAMSNVTQVHYNELVREYYDQEVQSIFYYEDGTMRPSMRKTLRPDLFTFLAKESNSDYKIDLEHYHQLLVKYEERLQTTIGSAADAGSDPLKKEDIETVAKPMKENAFEMNGVSMQGKSEGKQDSPVEQFKEAKEVKAAQPGKEELPDIEDSQAPQLLQQKVKPVEEGPRGLIIA